MVHFKTCAGMETGLRRAILANVNIHVKIQFLYLRQFCANSRLNRLCITWIDAGPWHQMELFFLCKPVSIPVCITSQTMESIIWYVLAGSVTNFKITSWNHMKSWKVHIGLCWFWNTVCVFKFIFITFLYHLYNVWLVPLHQQH